MSVNWQGQIRALVQDGYEGWLHLETHWKGPGGDKRLANRLSATALAQMVTDVS